MRISDWSSDVCSSDLEKIFHFDHERIPERIVHARGSGAHGVFECTRAIPELTKASIFQKEGASCPVFVRFSTVAGGAGSVDTPRDVRGFAVKLYTETRSEEHTSELQSLMRISYAVFCLKK